MTTGYKDIAQRIVNAENNFSETIQNIGGCSPEVADKVTAYYLKHKIAKLDAVIGRITVKHGVYLEADVVANAIEAVS